MSAAPELAAKGISTDMRQLSLLLLVCDVTRNNTATAQDAGPEAKL